MVKVTIELLPFGSEQGKRTLGVIEIANDSSGSATVGNYSFTLSKQPPIAKTVGIWKKGKIFGFPRRRLGGYDLVYRVLKEAVGGRNDKT